MSTNQNMRLQSTVVQNMRLQSTVVQNMRLQSTVVMSCEAVENMCLKTLDVIKEARADKFAEFCDKFRKNNTRPARLFGLIPAKTCTTTDEEIRAEIDEKTRNINSLGTYEWSDLIDLMSIRNDAGYESFKYQEDAVKKILVAARKGVNGDGVKGNTMTVTVADLAMIDY